MTWKLSANPDGKNPSSHLHHREQKDKEKTKQKTEKPHDQTNPAPLAWEARAVLGGGGDRTVRSDPPPSARQASPDSRREDG